MIGTSSICVRGVMCGAVMLASAAVSPDLRASTECQAPLVVHADHWERPPTSEAELLAARFLQREGRLVAADDASRRGLAQEIDEVLSRLREEFPGMANIVARESSETPRRVILELEPDLLDAVDRALGNSDAPVPLRTGNVDFDCLNARLGLRAVNVYRRLDAAVLSFGHRIDFMEAMTRYSKIEGVGYVESDAFLGDGPDVGMRRSEKDWFVVFRDASGDCPSGCLYEELHFFVVEGDEVERVNPARASEISAFPAIAAERGWRALAAAPGADDRGMDETAGND